MIDTKKLLILSILFITLSGFSLGFAGGDGSSSNPYEISTCSELQDVTNQAYTDNFELVNDIDCSGSTQSTILFQNPYEGTFNGNGYTISGLTISESSSQTSGLFGRIGNGAEITNVKFENADILGGGQSFTDGGVGTVAGNLVGGSVNINNIEIRNSVIEANSYGGGGLVGISDSSSLTANNIVIYNTDVISNERAGGIIAYSNSQLDLDNYVFEKSTVQTGSDVTGGIYGWVDGSSQVNNVAFYQSDVIVTGNSDYVGALTGANTGTSDFYDIYVAEMSTLDTNGADPLFGDDFEATPTTSQGIYVDTETVDGSSSGSYATGLTSSQMTGSSASTNMNEFTFGSGPVEWTTQSNNYPVQNQYESTYITEPAFFDIVSIDRTFNDTVPQGLVGTIGYTVENTGGSEGTQDIELYDITSDFVFGSETVTLQPGDSYEGEFISDSSGVPTGVYDSQVRSNDDNIGYTVEITDEPYMNITQISTNSPVTSGNNLEVTVDYTNEADNSGSINLDLLFDGSVVETESTGNVSSGTSGSTTFTYDTTGVSGNDYNIQVNSVYDSISDTVTIDQPQSNFAVTIDNYDSEVTIGDNFNLDYTVENIGDLAGTQDIRLNVAGNEEARYNGLSLNPGESFSDSFSVNTTGISSGFTLADLISDDDVETVDFTINEPAFFDITIDSTNSPVEEGNLLNVDYTVENTGDLSDTQDITLSYETEANVVDTDPSLTLNGGESFSGTLEYNTQEFDGEIGGVNKDIWAKVDDSTATDTVNIFYEPSPVTQTLEVQDLSFFEATLRGEITDMDRASQYEVYFEYEENGNTFTTDTQLINNTGEISETVSIEQDSTYIYNMVVEHPEYGQVSQVDDKIFTSPKYTLFNTSLIDFEATEVNSIINEDLDKSPEKKQTAIKSENDIYFATLTNTDQFKVTYLDLQTDNTVESNTYTYQSGRMDYSPSNDKVYVSETDTVHFLDSETLQENSSVSTEDNNNILEMRALDNGNFIVRVNMPSELSELRGYNVETDSWTTLSKATGNYDRTIESVSNNYFTYHTRDTVGSSTYISMYDHDFNFQDEINVYNSDMTSSNTAMSYIGKDEEELTIINSNGDALFFNITDSGTLEGEIDTTTTNYLEPSNIDHFTYLESQDIYLGESGNNQLFLDDTNGTVEYVDYSGVTESSATFEGDRFRSRYFFYQDNYLFEAPFDDILVNTFDSLSPKGLITVPVDNDPRIEFTVDTDVSSQGEVEFFIRDENSTEWTSLANSTFTSGQEQVVVDNGDYEIELMSEYDWYASYEIPGTDWEGETEINSFSAEFEPSIFRQLFDGVISDLLDLPDVLQPHITNLGLYLIGTLITLTISGIGYRAGGGYTGLIGLGAGIVVASLWGWFPITALFALLGVVGLWVMFN